MQVLQVMPNLVLEARGPGLVVQLLQRVRGQLALRVLLDSALGSAVFEVIEAVRDSGVRLTEQQQQQQSRVRVRLSQRTLQRTAAREVWVTEFW